MKESFTAEPACIHRLQPLWQTSNVPSKLCAHTGCKTSTHKKTWSAHVPLKNVFAHIRIFHTRHPEHCRRAFCASMYDEDLKFEWIVCVIYLISRINSIVFIEPQSLAMQAVAVCTMQLQLDIFKCKSWLKIWKNGLTTHQFNGLLEDNVPSKLSACACAHRLWDECTQENFQKYLCTYFIHIVPNTVESW